MQDLKINPYVVVKDCRVEKKRGQLYAEIVLWMYCSDPIWVILLGTFKLYGATAELMGRTSLNNENSMS